MLKLIILGPLSPPARIDSQWKLKQGLYVNLEGWDGLGGGREQSLPTAAVQGECRGLGGAGGQLSFPFTHTRSSG